MPNQIVATINALIANANGGDGTISAHTKCSHLHQLCRTDSAAD